MAAVDDTDTLPDMPAVTAPRGRLYKACVRLLVERGNTAAVEILRGLDPWKS